MKKGLLLLFFSLSIFCMHAQIVITEISYNPPESGADSLEYIELYNNSASAVDLQGYNFDAGVVYTFPVSTVLNPGEFVIVAVDSVAFENNFGIPAFEWTDNGLSNSGEAIVLSDGLGTMVDSVDYDDSNGWPSNADGLGASLVLCDFDADNTDPVNWASATTGTGIIIDGIEVFANPGAESACQDGPVVRFLDDGVELSEADGTIMVPVALFDGAAGMTSTVDVILGIGSTAINGADYNFTPGTLSFTMGAAQDTQMVTLTLIDDMDPEILETVVLELANAGGSASIDPVNSAFTITIADNDTEVAELVISEIMYNNPGTDNYEYLEIVNAGTEAVNMMGYTFSQGIDYTFGDFTLMPGAYVVIATDSLLFNDAYGLLPFQFEDGALGNGGETIELTDPSGNVVDVVTYDDAGEWPTAADGSGASLILCDLSADNNVGANWIAAPNGAGVIVEGAVVTGSPGAVNDCSDPNPTAYPAYPIGVVTTNDAEGLPDSIGVTCELQGIVYGENIRPGGLQFTLIDDLGDGIHIFLDSGDFGYTVAEGDEVVVQGVIAQFRGLTQLNPDTVYAVSSGNTLDDPEIVTELGEETESQLVTLEVVEIIDPAQWTNSGSGFNVDVTNGIDTFAVRIDADVNIFGEEVPMGVLNITGIGGQFDSTSPFDDGYQLLPRYLDDIVVVNSVSEAEFEQGIQLFPNPTADILNITLDIEVDNIQLTNILGQSLQIQRYSNSWNEQNIQLDLSNLAPGMYFLTFTSEGSKWTTQVIRQ